MAHKIFVCALFLKWILGRKLKPLLKNNRGRLVEDSVHKFENNTILFGVKIFK